MPSDLTSLPATCPICLGTDFTPEMSGFPVKSPAYRCRQCASLIKPAVKSGMLSFHIEKLGPAYSNAGFQLKGSSWSAEELTQPDHESSIHADDDLLRLAQGTIGEDFLAGEDPSQVPFPIADGETVIFALQTVYTWDTRPKDEQVAPGLKAFQIKPGAWKDVTQRGEPKTVNLYETLDDGDLYLTDRRLIYTGKRRQIDEDLARVIAVVPFQDGIGVLRKERIKIECYKGQYYWPLVGAVLAGLANRRKKGHAPRETS
jgi:hypothetical protein